MTVDLASIGFIIRIVIVLLVGVPALVIASRTLSHVLKDHTSTHVSILVGNIALYVGCTFLAISILHDLGFNLSAFLGAAGIVGIAVGFAAQTSVANIISGLFLVLEGSCAIGDRVAYESFVGTIESIDLLSVKIRTVENTFVRIPNEFFIKKIMVNRTYYPTRIILFKVGVSVDDDMQRVTELIHEVVAADTLFLHTPAPKINLFEVTLPMMVGTDYQHPYVMNELKVEVGVQRGTETRARDQFLRLVQKRLHRENIRATITRL